MAGPIQVAMVLGSQWGDEGKGKLVDILAQQVNVVARCNGGANAGHTIVANGKIYALHLLPSGVVADHTFNLVGNGVVVHVSTLLQEIENLESSTGVSLKGRLFISDRAHALFDFHRKIDGLIEAELSGKSLGTTKRGVGPCYASKATREGLRMGDLLDITEEEEAKLKLMVSRYQKRFGDSFDCSFEDELASMKKAKEALSGMIVDGPLWLNNAVREGKSVLIEGANAAMLDIDFGTYPYVTSSNTTVGGCFTGLGLSPRKLDHAYGVVKAYTTRVGEGPFPTEDTGKIGEHFQTVGHEYGTTTGRKRRCGWLDLVQLEYSMMINGYTAINLTKLDVLSGLEEIKVGVSYVLNGEKLPGFPSSLRIMEKVDVQYETLQGWREDITGCRSFEDLPRNARNYISYIEKKLDCPVWWIGVGPARDATIDRSGLTWKSTSA